MDVLTKLIPTQLIHATSMALLHSIWILLLVGLLLFGFRSLLKSDQHQLKYLSAMAALFTGFCSVVASFFYYFSIPLSGNVYAESQSIANTSVLVEPSTASISTQESFGLLETLIQNEHLIILLWLLGVMILFVRLIISLMATQQLKQTANICDQPQLIKLLNRLKDQMSISAKVQLKLSSKICGPMMLGCIKPTILLPIMLVTQLNEDELKAVIAHELAHIQRHDYIINFLQSVAETILYYHPVVWWIRSIAEQEREICCDQMALTATNDKHTYASVLIKMQEWKLSEASNVAMSFSGNKHQFKNRILSIFQQPTSGRSSKEKAIVIMAIMIMGFGFVGFNYVNPTPSQDVDLIEECVDEEILTEDKLEGICIKISDTSKTDGEIRTIAQLQKCSSKQKCCKPVIASSDDKSKACCKSNKQQCIKLDENTAVEIVVNISDASENVNLGSTTEISVINKHLDNVSLEEVEIIIQDHISKADTNTEVYYVKHQLNETQQGQCEPIQRKLTKKRHYTQVAEKLPSTEEIKTSCLSLSAVYTMELVEDGLISKDDSFIFELNGKELLLNGKKQTESIWKKYKSIYENRVGDTMNEASQIVVQHNSSQTKAYF